MRRLTLLVAVLLGLIFAPQAQAQDPPCTQTLSAGANVSTAIAGAAGGSVICLNSGSYAQIQLTTYTKSPRVTVRSVTPGGAQVAGISVSGGSAPNGVTLQGFTLTANSTFSANNNARNVTLTGMNFNTRGVAIYTNSYNANNVLVANSTFGGFNRVSGGPEGRLNIVFAGGPGSNPSGVTAQGNTFEGGGCSDGIQIGSRGVQVLDNIFRNLLQGSCSTHVDATQGYGDAGTVLDGNLFLSNTVAIGWYDGGSGHTFTDNVIGGASGQVTSIRGITNSTFVHNTLRNANFRINGKSGDPSGLTIRYNLFHGGGLVDDWGCTGCTISNNHNAGFGTIPGSGNTTGTPVYVGGASPQTWSGHQLAAGSPGKGAADGGSDMGIRVGTTPPPPDPPTAAYTYTPASPQTEQVVSFDGSSTDCDSTPCTYSWAENGVQFATGVTATRTFVTAGSRTVTLTVTDSLSRSDPEAKTVTVTAPQPDAPTAVVAMSPLDPETGEQVTFDGVSSDCDATPCAYAWTEDGSPVGAGQTLTRTYATAGQRTVQLTVTDALSRSDSDSVTFMVTSPPPPDTPADANWTAPTNAETGTPVSLDGSSSTGDAPLVCLWRFYQAATGPEVWETFPANGVATAAACSFSKTFSNVGEKYVGLQVTDVDGDTNEDRKTFTVSAPGPTPDPPVAAFTYSPLSPVAGQTVNFNSATTDCDAAPCTFEWLENTAPVGTGPTLSRTYATAGNRSIELIVTDALSRVDTDMQTVVVTPGDVPADAVWTAPVGAVTGTPVTLDGSGSTGNAPIVCLWSFENQSGSTVWETVPANGVFTSAACTISKTFSNADTKYVELHVRDADGDTDVNRQSFAVSAP